MIFNVKINLDSTKNNTSKFMSMMQSLKDATNSKLNDNFKTNSEIEIPRLTNKLNRMNSKSDSDMDRFLSEVLDSNISHSYHSNFKDSIKELVQGK